MRAREKEGEKVSIQIARISEINLRTARRGALSDSLSKFLGAKVVPCGQARLSPRVRLAAGRSGKLYKCFGE